MREWIKHFAWKMKSQVKALHLASRDPRTPFGAKCLAVIIVAYALSPIDLIPDFIPVLGYLDDIIILPLGIFLLIRWLPDDVWFECQQRAEQIHTPLPKSPVIAWVIILIWIAIILMTAYCVEL
jgi:uncharacterized membrane protein YkvA (DUF1232 family)